MGCVWAVADEGGMLSGTGECPRFEGHAEQGQDKERDRGSDDPSAKTDNIGLMTEETAEEETTASEQKETTPKRRRTAHGLMTDALYVFV